MATWFECKFKYNREDQNGGFTTISEVYLIDAVSFTDAEARVYEEIGANYKEFILLKVSKYRVHELVHNENGGLTWYKCKVAITSLDEKSGKEKKLKQTILVNSNNIKEAYGHVEELFAASVSDYAILDIVTTQIVEILPYIEDEAKRNLVPLAPPPGYDEDGVLIEVPEQRIFTSDFEQEEETAETETQEETVSSELVAQEEEVEAEAETAGITAQTEEDAE